MDQADEPLRECPCCGGPGKVKSFNGHQVRQGWVGCPECGLYIQWKVNPAAAIKKWNRRFREIEVKG